MSRGYDAIVIGLGVMGSAAAYGCGFSGHGFKLAAVIGEILADLATERATRHAIGFLSARRFAPAAAGQ